MTGFGSGRRESAAVRVQIELRSVNHRYLKIAAHVPDELAWTQHPIEQRIRTLVERGSLSLSLEVETIEEGTGPILDGARLERLWREVRAVRDRIAPEERVSFSDLLALPGVVSVADPIAGHHDAVLPVIEGAVDDALEALRAMQAREGDHLRVELGAIAVDLETWLAEIAQALPAAAAQNRDRYRARVIELLAGLEVEVDAGDLWREAALLAERADVTEELGRLRGHLVQFRRLLEEGGRVGRRLDFLTQEMFREANTMASKLNRSELSQKVVDAKAEIDRLREQTQNIE
jgi:uncharacterized protein (TIGR00255 family)